MILKKGEGEERDRERKGEGEGRRKRGRRRRGGREREREGERERESRERLLIVALYEVLLFVNSEVTSLDFTCCKFMVTPQSTQAGLPLLWL